MEMKIKYVMLAAFAAVSIGLCAAGGAGEVQTYTTRIVGMDSKSVPGSIVYTYKRGAEVWKTTNTVQRMAIQATPNRYSKLKIIVAAKEAGKWSAVKEFLSTNDLMDEWNACLYIEDGNPYFVRATNAVVAAGIATDEAVKAFLDAAKDRDL